LESALRRPEKMKNIHKVTQRGAKIFSFTPCFFV
jgi:hypothetical protein